MFGKLISNIQLFSLILRSSNKVYSNQVVNNCFLRKIGKLRCANMALFCMQLEKWGRGLLREESGLKALGEGGGKENLLEEPPFSRTDTLPFPPSAFNQQPTLPHSGKLPAVTHTPTFQTTF